MAITQTTELQRMDFTFTEPSVEYISDSSLDTIPSNLTLWFRNGELLWFCDVFTKQGVRVSETIVYADSGDIFYQFAVSHGLDILKDPDTYNVETACTITSSVCTMLDKTVLTSATSIAQATLEEALETINATPLATVPDDYVFDSRSVTPIPTAEQKAARIASLSSSE